MATTFVEYTGDGQASKQFTFPSYQESDVKVRVDGVLKTTSTHYNITNYTTTGGGNVVFTSGNIPSSPANIRIYRDTNVDTAKATFTAGSSVKAADLNNNTTQLLYRAQEEQIPNLIHSYDIDDSAITSAKIEDGTIVNADINASAAIAGSKIAAATTSAAGSMSAADKTKLDGIETGATADQTNAEIRAAVEAASDSNVFTDADHSKLNAIEAGATADQTASEIKTLIASSPLDASHLAANSVDNSELADGSVTSAKIANGTIQAVDLATNAVATNRIADGAITEVKIADSNVSTIKLADAELRTLAGMQSGTASILASGTALTASTTELNQLSGITLETSVSPTSNVRIPTSKAVNDQILAVTNALGGFVAIADETSFPTANPDPSNGAGTVVSISQVSSGSAITINSSGVATIANGAGTGNTVTITGFPTTLRNTSLAASSGLQVQTTTTLHTYTFHKQLASAADIAAISATVNSFSNRYRVSSSAPTSSLDGGDLWYDTTNSKLMVYSSQNSAWEEATAIGNFFISTISSSSNSGGGSATPNGTATRFTISDAPTSAAQLIVSVDGVIQKPNSGSSAPSEGFVLVGNDIIFGAAPANGASLFVTVIGSTVGIGTPSNNTVTSAILQNGSVIEAKLGTGAVTEAKLGTGAVTSAKIADGTIVNADVNASAAIDVSKLSGVLPLTASSSNSLTGDLHFNKNNPLIALTDNNSNPDYYIGNIGGAFRVRDTTNSSTRLEITASTTTISNNLDVGAGVDVTGGITATDHVTINADSKRFMAGASNDARMYHDGTDSYFDSVTGNLYLYNNASAKNITFGTEGQNRWQIYNNGHLVPAGDSGFDIGTNTVRVRNAYVDTYYGDGSNLTGINTDLVSDTSPELGGELETNGNDIHVHDNDQVKFGAAADLYIKHSSGHNSNFIVSSGVDIEHHMGSSKKIIKGFENSGTPYISLYSNGVEKLKTDNSLGVIFNHNHGGSEPLCQAAAKGAFHCGFVADANTGYQSHFRFAQNGSMVAQLRMPANSTQLGMYFFGTGKEHDFFGDGSIDFAGHVKPKASNTYDLGNSSKRWRNIYTQDLQLSNEAVGDNGIDGTWGNYTIVEGESDLFLKNNRSGKTYKFNLTEVS